MILAKNNTLLKKSGTLLGMGDSLPPYYTLRIELNSAESPKKITVNSLICDGDYILHVRRGVYKSLDTGVYVDLTEQQLEDINDPYYYFEVVLDTDEVLLEFEYADSFSRVHYNRYSYQNNVDCQLYRGTIDALGPQIGIGSGTTDEISVITNVY